MRYPLAIGASTLSLLLVGCTATQSPKPKLAIPDLATTPYVEFVGDAISQGMLAAAANPMWKCSACAPQLSSTQALNGFKTILALHPDVVHILVGTYELTGSTQADEGVIPGNNIGTMVNEAKSAGVSVVVGTLPPCPSINAGRLNLVLYDNYVGMPPSYPPLTEGVPLAAYDTIGPFVAEGQVSPVCATGYLPNAAGYGLMVTLAQQAIQGLHAGEVR